MDPFTYWLHLMALQLATCIGNPAIPLSWFLPEVQVTCAAVREAQGVAPGELDGGAAGIVP